MWKSIDGIDNALVEFCGRALLPALGALAICGTLGGVFYALHFWWWRHTQGEFDIFKFVCTGSFLEYILEALEGLDGGSDVVRRYDFMPEEIYREQWKTADNGSLSKVLLYDIVHQSRCSVAGICQVGACQTCYWT